MERCNKCRRRLKRQALEIGTGYCNVCGHAVMSAAAARAQRVGNIRLEAMASLADQLTKMRRDRDRMAHERFAAVTTPLFN